MLELRTALVAADPTNAQLRRSLAEADPTHVEVQLEWVITEGMAAWVEFASGAKAAAKPHRDAAQAVLDQLARDERLTRLPRFQALQQGWRSSG